MAGAIIFNKILVNSQETNGGIFLGENVAPNWETNNKNQIALGMVYGTFNSLPVNVNITLDNDYIDTLINDPDIQGIGPIVQY